MAPDLSKRVDAEGQPQINEITGRQEDPLGWLGETAAAAALRDPARVHWFSLIGVLGLQPIMPLDLPVKVRSWELTVYPRSHIRRWFGVTRPAQARM